MTFFAPAPILQMRKLRHSKAKWLAQGHSYLPDWEASLSQPWARSPGTHRHDLLYVIIGFSGYLSVLIASAACSQTLVPETGTSRRRRGRRKFGRPMTRRRGRQGKGKGQPLPSPCKTEPIGHFCWKKSLQRGKKKTHLVFLDKLLKPNKWRTPPNTLSFQNH